MRLLKLLLLGITLMCFTIAGSAAATAEPMGPYIVTEAGITLPEGATFPDGGHVNVNSEPNAWNMHFEAKCIDRTDYECAGKIHDDAQYIGASFIPWSAFGLTGKFCVTWVQVANYDYHFGENGEDPLCIGEPPIEEPPVIEEPPIIEEPPVKPELPGDEEPTWPEIGEPNPPLAEEPPPVEISTPVVADSPPAELAKTGTSDLLVMTAGMLVYLGISLTVYGMSRRFSLGDDDGLS